MRTLARLLVLTAVISFGTGCEPKEVEETVWDDQVKAMDKARDVEEKLMNRAEQLGREIDKETDEEDPPQR